MMRAPLRVLAILLCGLADLAWAAPNPQPPALRLGEALRPLAYEVELAVNPAQDRLQGRMSISLELAEATSFFWLNAQRLELKKVVLVVGTRTIAARVVVTSHDFVGIRLPQGVQPGRATLIIDYEGSFERIDSAGAFRVREGDDWYVFTQFEPSAARRVFPCFDEPGWKTPWKITLDVPIGDTAVSNMPALGEDPQPGNMKRVRFAATGPVPSYQVGFAVGPFDIVDGVHAGRKGVPIRYLAPRGRATESRFAQRATPRLVENLEDYLSESYPFDKLDVLAVPVTSGFHSSQGPGLVALQADLLLAKPDQEGSEFQKTYVGVAAKALAQQWIGDRVALQWWDDRWLNEGITSWLASKLSQRFDPEWLTRLALDRHRQEAVFVDRLVGSHALRVPIDGPDDLPLVFDRLTTEKAAALMRMLETWMGEDHFRAGVQRYLAATAQGASRSDDLLAALIAEMPADTAALTGVYQAMVERPGVPELDVTLACPGAGKGTPRLELVQQRYAPLSHVIASDAGASTPAAGPWMFPACFQYGEGGDFGEQCVVVRESRQVMQLPEGESCPEWVIANRDGTSYVVPVLRDPLPARLDGAPLLPDEAVAVIGDTRILAAARDLPIDRALRMAARFAGNRQPPVVSAALALLEDVPPASLGSAEDRVGFARYVRAEFGQRAQALGWLGKPGEREVDALLRAELLPVVADRGADPLLRSQADKLARDWLAGKVPLGSMLRPILVTAAHFGSSDLFEGYLAAADRAVGRDRRDLYQALGAFRDPQLLDQALSLVLSDRIDARDAWAVYVAAGSDPVSVPAVLRFAADHYDALAKRIPEGGPAWLAGLGAGLCENGPRRDYENFYSDAARRALAGAHVVAQALAAADVCIANRDLQAENLHAFLAQPE